MTDTKKITKVCEHCGSEDVHCDATAEWSDVTQAWVLAQLLDTTLCNDCDCERTVVDKEIKLVNDDDKDNMKVYELIVKEKSDCEIDTDKVLWIAVPDNIKLALTDDAIAQKEYELVLTNYDRVIIGTDIVATVVE